MNNLMIYISKTVRNKKWYIILILVLLFCLYVIRYIPYKLPIELDRDYTELVIECGEDIEIVSGKEELNSYLKIMDDDTVKDDGIRITGNTPKMTINLDRINKYSTFRIYGEFTEVIDSDNRLFFNIIDWYPVDQYVCLGDTYIWNSFRFIFVYVSGIIGITIYVSKLLRGKK